MGGRKPGGRNYDRNNRICGVRTGGNSQIKATSTGTNRVQILLSPMYPGTYKILNDERVMNLLRIHIGDTLVSFDEIKLLLEKPDSVHKIILPSDGKAIELCWSQG